MIRQENGDIFLSFNFIVSMHFAYSVGLYLSASICSLFNQQRCSEFSMYKTLWEVLRIKNENNTANT